MEQVDFAYGNQVIFKDVTLQLPHQQFVAIVGDNGAGKTTLLRLMLGELPIQKGTVQVFGQSITQAISTQQIAYISQQSLATYKQFPTTVDEVLTIHLQFLKKTHEKQQIIQAVHLQNHTHKRLMELSGGQLQRLAIALALIQDAPLILLDEPTNNIDARFTRELYVILKELVTQGKTVIMVTHHIQDALPFVDKVIEVSNCSCRAIDTAHFHVSERGVKSC